MEIIWKDIPGYDGKYQVSNYGDVIDKATGTARGKRFRPDGYYDLWLSKGGKGKILLTHRLVLMAFKGMPTKEKPLTRHLDGNRINNYVDNLEWGDYKENRADRLLHGTSSTYSVNYRGEKCPLSILKNEDVSVIKLLFHMTNLKHREIAKLFGVQRELISKIYQGRRWSHIKIGA